MLTEKEIAELRGSSDQALRDIMTIMKYQVKAMLFVGDRERSQEIYDAAETILAERANG